MILKEMEIKNKVGNLKNQGNESEKRMAFYLRRKFKDVENIFVFNDILIKHHEEYAQIDHLIFHEKGFVLVESKSCLGIISYNSNGEWSRETGSYKQGFSSPIKQMERQIDILTELINDNAEELLGEFKLLGVKLFMQGVSKRAKDLIVAIDDNAIIERDEKANFGDIVLKADHVCDKIHFIINKKYNDGIFNTKNSLPSFKAKEMKDICDFILLEDKNNREIKKEDELIVSKRISSSNKKDTIRENKCFGCGKEGDLTLLYGRYGYYFKCLNCNKNENIKEKCPSCQNNKTKIKKFKQNFYLDCECGLNKLYFKNIQ